MNKTPLAFFLIFCLLGLSSSASGNEPVGRFSFGFGYPYASIKYGLSERYQAELRCAFDSGITVAGARAYRSFLREGRTSLFSGIEGSYITFKTDEVRGDGFLVLAFAGGEYAVTKRFAFTFDIGPVYTWLRNAEYASISVSGIDWVLNTGFSYSFDLSRSSHEK